MTRRVFTAVVVSWVIAFAAVGAQTPRSRTLSRAIRTPSRRAWAFPLPLRRLPRHGRPRRPRARHHAGLGSGRTDDGLFKTIKSGVPSTEMPASTRRACSDHEVWQILAYLRTLAAPAPTDPPRGNAENGEKIFRANVRQLPSRQRRRRTARTRSVAHRRGAGARRDGAPHPARLAKTSSPASSR